MKLTNMDIVYIVRPGDDNEELRYSLRTVAKNLPHRRVVIAGHTPDWVKNVHSIEVSQDGDKYENAAKNWAAAMDDESVSEAFIAMNDDFYIMKPLHTLPTLHRGDLERVIGYYIKTPGPYLYNMRETRDMLLKLGCQETELKSYALHVPMVMEKTKRRITTYAIEALGKREHNVQMRTLYGNLWRIGGEEMADVKSSNRNSVIAKNDTFLSSNDQAFNEGSIGQLLREQFSEKCNYER